MLDGRYPKGSGVRSRTTPLEKQLRTFTGSNPVFPALGKWRNGRRNNSVVLFMYNKSKSVRHLITKMHLFLCNTGIRRVPQGKS